MQILLTCKQVWFYVTPIMISINQFMSEGTDSCKAVAMEVAHMKAFGQKRFGIETVRLLLSSACVIEGQDPGTRVLHSMRPGGCMFIVAHQPALHTTEAPIKPTLFWCIYCNCFFVVSIHTFAGFAVIRVDVDGDSVELDAADGDIVDEWSFQTS